MNDDQFLKVAKEAALEAGKIIEGYFGKNLKKRIKKNDESNFATTADLEAEKLILGIIKDNFFDHNFIAEESGVKNNNSDYTWVIDPLDGTTAFTVGWPTFSVSIGLLKNNKPFLGVIYQVMTKDLYWAQQGKGAFLNGKKINVSTTEQLKDAAIGVDFAHRSSRAAKVKKYVIPLSEKVAYPFSMCSDALVFAMVGGGKLDGFANEDNIWDCIAGVLIIIEAGGKVTDTKGGAIDWTKKRMEIVVSNGLIHEQILSALRQ